MNWGDCKLLALKKIDPAIQSIIPSRNNKDYLSGMIGAANRGLKDLATTRKFNIRSAEIYQPKGELVASSKPDDIIDSRKLTVSGIGKSFHIEVFGKGKLILTKNKFIEFESTSSFKKIKDNIEEDLIDFKIESDSVCFVKNVAIYKDSYLEVPDYGPYIRIDLKEKIDDFYKVINNNDFNMEGDSVIVLPSDSDKLLNIRYAVYPGEITSNTKDDYELDLDPEVAELLPVYIAAEVYEEEDSGTAFYFREQYEQSKNRLRSNDSETRTAFEDDYGWS